MDKRMSWREFASGDWLAADSHEAPFAGRLFGKKDHTVMTMRKDFASSIVVLCCGLWTWGCGPMAGSDRHENHGPSATPVASQGRQQAVSLSGCVELSGTAIGGYVLQKVHIEGRDGQDPQRTSTHPPTGIVEGSWVRLTGAGDLPALAGRRVLVSGVIVDTGWSTIGTSVSGVVLPSGDVSRAASDEPHWKKVKKEAGPIGRESIATGTAPEVKVTEIKDLGEGCHEQNERR